MALAPFFDKTALSAASILRGFDRPTFERKLAPISVGIFFGGEHETGAEQGVILDLLVNLLARLYPTISLICPSSNDSLNRLKMLAVSINPDIEIRTTSDNLSIAVSTVASPLLDAVRGNCPIVYIGSSGWIAKVSTARPVGSGDTRNPFGASMAACLGAANVFRHAFADQLAEPTLDEDLTFNVLDYSGDAVDSETQEIPLIDVGDTTLVGVGAIGNAAVWALGRVETLCGRLRVVDHEVVDLGNLQRYVLTSMASIGVPKVDLVRPALTNDAVTVEGVPSKWSEYLDHDVWDLPRLAIAVDTIQERVNISGALAKEVINSWTQADEVGISRHLNFGAEACLCCLYYPDREVPNEAELVGAAVGLADDPMLVRDLLQTGRPVDRLLLTRIAASLHIRPEDIWNFEGRNLRQFHSEAVCGGVLLRLGATASTNTEVPMAFQSALAGIFLAAEIVISAGHLRNQPIANSTRVRLSTAIPETPLVPVAVKSRCICQDPFFRSAYERKYGAPQGR